VRRVSPRLGSTPACIPARFDPYVTVKLTVLADCRGVTEDSRGRAVWDELQLAKELRVSRSTSRSRRPGAPFARAAYAFCGTAFSPRQLSQSSFMFAVGA